MEVLRKLNNATSIYFPLIDYGATDFEDTPVTFAAGDTQYSIDGAAFGNTNSNPAHEGGGIYSLALTAGELNGAVIVVRIIDQDATKTWEDQAIVIATYGGGSAEHDLNVLADYILRRAVQSAIDSSDGDAKSFRSLLGAVCKLVNRIYPSGSNLIITEDDDTTTLGTQAMTTDSGADPVTELNTV
jgi:hypothetical protein